MSVLTAGALGWMTSKGPFQHRGFYDSMIILIYWILKADVMLFFKVNGSSRVTNYLFILTSGILDDAQFCRLTPDGN